MRLLCVPFHVIDLSSIVSITGDSIAVNSSAATFSPPAFDRRGCRCCLLLLLFFSALISVTPIHARREIKISRTRRTRQNKADVKCLSYLFLFCGILSVVFSMWFGTRQNIATDNYSISAQIIIVCRNRLILFSCFLNPERNFKSIQLLTSYFGGQKY